MPYLITGGRLPATPGYRLGLPSRERDAELRPYGLRGIRGERGVLDELDQQSRVATGARRLREGLAGVRLGVVGLDPDSPEQMAWSTTALTALSEMIADRDNPGQRSSSAVLRQLADEWLRGVYLAAWSWVTDPHASLGARLELYQIPSSTVRRWDTWGHDGSGWTGVEYDTSTYGSRYIHRDDLVYVRTRGTAAQLEGEAITRPLVFPVDCWRETAKAILMAQSIGSGIVVATSPGPGPDSEDWQTVREMLQDIEIGTRRTALLPHGWTLDVDFPAAGASSGAVEILTYWDGQIDHAMDSVLTSLGFSSHGSRALGEAMLQADRQIRMQSMGTLLAAFGSAVLPLIAERVGYVGALGELQPTLPEETDVTALVEMVGGAKDRGLIRWGRVREAWLASQIDGLPDEPEETEEDAALPAPPAPRELSRPRYDCVRLSADGLVRVTDYDGAEFDAPRPLTPLERLVSWVRLSAEYDAAAATLEAVAGDLAREQRAELARVLSGMDRAVWTTDSTRGIQRRYEERYAAAIQLAVEAIAESVSRAAREEAERQGGSPGSGAMVGAGAIIAEVMGEVVASIGRAAESISSRVAGEMEEFWTLGGDVADFVPSQTDRGLASEADGVLHLVESRARIMVAVQSVGDEEDPMVPVEVDRVEIMDKNLCDPCRTRGANGAASVVIDMTRPDWADVLAANPLPDVVNCEGGESCRCRWIVRWARLSSLPLDVQRRYREGS